MTRVSRPVVALLVLWLDRTPRPGWQNMSLDMSLHARAARTGRGYLRFYRWSPSCLSFGRHEPALKRYDRDRITTLGLDTVRRPTGGRAVWHAGRGHLFRRRARGGDGIAARRRTSASTSPSRRRSARWAPRWNSPLPGAACRSMPGACFAAAAGGEVVLDAGKVVGSAQLRHGGAVLQHGSVLLDDDQSLVSDITRWPGGATGCAAAVLDPRTPGRLGGGRHGDRRRGAGVGRRVGGAHGRRAAPRAESEPLRGAFPRSRMDLAALSAAPA